MKAHADNSGSQHDGFAPSFAKLAKAIQIGYLRQLDHAFGKRTSRRFVGGWI